MNNFKPDQTRWIDIRFTQVATYVYSSIKYFLLSFFWPQSASQLCFATLSTANENIWSRCVAYWIRKFSQKCWPRKSVPVHRSPVFYGFTNDNKFKHFMIIQRLLFNSPRVLSLKCFIIHVIVQIGKKISNDTAYLLYNQSFKLTNSVFYTGAFASHSNIFIKLPVWNNFNNMVSPIELFIIINFNKQIMTKTCSYSVD